MITLLTGDLYAAGRGAGFARIRGRQCVTNMRMGLCPCLAFQLQ